MVRSITFLEKDYSYLKKHLFQNDNEQAAFLLCGLSETENEIRFLVKKVIPVLDKFILESNPMKIYYSYEAYQPVIKTAIRNNECFIIVHCHHNKLPEYSDIDNKEEIKLLKYAYRRIGNKYHGSLLLGQQDSFVGRILTPDDETYNYINKIRVLGDSYRFLYSSNTNVPHINNKDIFDRNILAFGEDLQGILQNLHVGVVGCGGTGSALIEQLCRLGVGKLTLIDNDSFESTNVTRIHGSNLSDKGIPKVMLMKNVIDKIGLGTNVVPINKKLDNIETVKKLRDCDIIFSCLDFTHYARAILNELSIAYYIPLIDTGIKFYSVNGELKDIYGRIDIVTPNVNCLLCRGVLTPQMIAAEQMEKEEYNKLKSEGYAPEIENDKLQAIPYNTLIASYAATEMIQLLINFKGQNNYHTIYRFIANKSSGGGVSENKQDSECVCTSPQHLGVGDVEPFLNMTW